MSEATQRGTTEQAVAPERRGTLEVEQLDVEDEHPGRRSRARRLVAVRGGARNPEPDPLAFRHELHALRPTLDDRVEPEVRGLAPGDGAVEHLPVGGPSR